MSTVQNNNTAAAGTAAADHKKPVRPGTVIIYLFLVFMAVIYLAPLVWIVLVSLKDNAGVNTDPFGWPGVLHFENYVQAFTMGKLGYAILNSLLVCGVTLVVSLSLGCMASFAIARMKWKLSEFINTFFMIGLMVPVHCILIPLFVRFAHLGLTNSRFGLMIPYITFSLSTVIFLMVNFFRSMPGEIFEAAAIDGCSIYRIFFTIAVPLSRTGLFVAGIMTFVGNWNELLMAMVFISDPMKKTLPVTLTYFVGPYATNYVQMFAAIVIAIAPTITVYCMFSNQIVDGLTAGAVKG